MSSSKVELYAAIRRDVRTGISARTIERKHGGGRRTIVKAMASAWPEPRKKLPPRASKLDPFKPVIDEMLRALSVMIYQDPLARLVSVEGIALPAPRQGLRPRQYPTGLAG